MTLKEIEIATGTIIESLEQAANTEERFCLDVAIELDRMRISMKKMARDLASLRAFLEA